VAVKNPETSSAFTRAEAVQPPRFMRARNVLMILLFVGLPTAVLGWFGYVVLAQKGLVPAPVLSELKFLAGWNPSPFPMPTLRRFASRFFQDHLELAAQQNFPLQGKLLPVCGRIRMAASDAAILPLPQTWEAELPVTPGVVLLRDRTRICGLPAVYSPEKRLLLAGRAAFYASAAAAHPGVRFFVVPVMPAGAWLATPAGCFGPCRDLLDGENYVAEFRGLLDPRIAYGWAGEGRTPAEALSLYYKTDHHFTMRGAYEVYRQLHHLLTAGFDHSDPPCQATDWTTVPEVKFYGSIARKAGGYIGLFDRIEDADFHLPGMKVCVWQSGRQTERRSAKEEYQQGQFNRSRFADHYTGYYGGGSGLVQYSCPGAPARHLLVIGDSYRVCLERLLAAHFQQAYFADLRYYHYDVGEEFDLSQFIRAHRITDVLFFGQEDWVLGMKQIEME
jgi:hypothetical protein